MTVGELRDLLAKYPPHWPVKLIDTAEVWSWDIAPNAVQVSHDAACVTIDVEPHAPQA
jgi:hypothetical protein